MEVTTSSNSKQQTRKKIVVGGVGGIAGLLIWGGALAAQNLIRNRSSKRRPDSNSREGGGEGLLSLLQTSPHCCRSSIEHDGPRILSTKINGYNPEPDTIETPVMEEKSVIEGNVEKNIPAYGDDDENGDSKADRNKDGVPIASSDKADSIEKENHADSPYSGAVSMNGEDNDDEEEDNDVPEITNVSDVLFEGNLLLPVKDEIEEDGGDEDNDGHDDKDNDHRDNEEEEMEIEREDSEGSGDSSIESNSEAIWPAESMEEELLMLKERAHVRILGETSNEVEVGGEFWTISSLATDSETELRPPSLILSRPGFWMWLLLAVGLLYLLFPRQLSVFYHCNDSQLSDSS